MCDTKGHEHWCSSCGKNLNKEPKDSYIEIEWCQNDSGEIVEEKSMICKSCLEESENIKELDKFFSELKYSPLGHIFCSSCKKDLTKELGKSLKPGIDYECLNFKCHKDSGQNIKHIIKVVVLCKDCVKTDFNADNIAKLKKLGRNPKFTPTVMCDKIDVCKQYNKGDDKVNCKNIVIGRDIESLEIAILCGRRHKGALPLPFDDGTSITRPRKTKGAAMASPQTFINVPGLNPFQDYIREIEKLLEKHKLGAFAKPSHVDMDDARLLAIETRLINLERVLGINSGMSRVRGEYTDIVQNSEPVPLDNILKNDNVIVNDKNDNINVNDKNDNINVNDDNVVDTNINKRPIRYAVVDCPE